MYHNVKKYYIYVIYIKKKLLDFPSFNVIRISINLLVPLSQCWHLVAAKEFFGHLVVAKRPKWAKPAKVKVWPKGLVLLKSDWHLAAAKDFFGHLATAKQPNSQRPTFGQMAKCQHCFI